MSGILKIERNKIIDTKFKINDWNLELNYTENFQIRSGIIEINEGKLQIHFTVEDNKI